MALIRQVRRHEQSRCWAYVESSDENPQYIFILGSKEFATKEEAEDFSKGFAPESYEWVEPTILKINRLKTEKHFAKKRLEEIEDELSSIYKSLEEERQA